MGFAGGIAEVAAERFLVITGLPIRSTASRMRQWSNLLRSRVFPELSTDSVNAFCKHDNTRTRTCQSEVIIVAAIHLQEWKGGIGTDAAPKHEPRYSRIACQMTKVSSSLLGWLRNGIFLQCNRSLCVQSAIDRCSRLHGDHRLRQNDSLNV
jgi:hypothetical protein